MKGIILVGLGGFLGSILRYLISLYSVKLFSNFLVGTLTVNLTGSFLIGLLAGMMGKPAYHHYQLFLLTGFCGGFTTFSTFSIEGIKLLKNAQYFGYLGYTTASVIGGLTLCFLGVWIAQKVVQ